MKVKGAIFDMDGVLCFTDKYHYEAWKATVEPLGLKFDEKMNNLLRGVSRRASLITILNQNDTTMPDEEIDRLCDEKNEKYVKLLSNITPSDLSADVMSALNGLKEKGIKLAIGSSSKNAKTILERLGIMDMFDGIADGNDIVNSKPDPEVFLKAAGTIDMEPGDCFVVEDAYAGIDAANNGGFISVAIGDAASYDKADVKIEKLSDLLAIVE